MPPATTSTASSLLPFQEPEKLFPRGAFRLWLVAAPLKENVPEPLDHPCKGFADAGCRMGGVVAMEGHVGDASDAEERCPGSTRPSDRTHP